jgi:hypothetical protein
MAARHQATKTSPDRYVHQQQLLGLITMQTTPVQRAPPLWPQG